MLPLQDDNVEEYEFSSEDEEEEDNIHDTDYYKHPGGIPLDSDDDKQTPSDWMDDYRPWRDPETNEYTRRDREIKYRDDIRYPMRGDWDVSETFQLHQDLEMQRYDTSSMHSRLKRC